MKLRLVQDDVVGGEAISQVAVTQLQAFASVSSRIPVTTGPRYKHTRLADGNITTCI